MTPPSPDYDERDTREWTIFTCPACGHANMHGSTCHGTGWTPGMTHHPRSAPREPVTVVPSSERVRADRAEKERDELCEALRVAADRLTHGSLPGNEHWWTLTGPLLSRLEKPDDQGDE